MMEIANSKIRTKYAVQLAKPNVISHLIKNPKDGVHPLGLFSDRDVMDVCALAIFSISFRLRLNSFSSN